MMARYSGKRALLIGGSCEIAIGLAEVIANKGLHPILTYRSDQSKARIEQSLHHLDGSFHCFPLDLSKVETIAALAQELDQGIDYLVDFAQEDLEGLVASTDSGMVASYFAANIAHRAELIQRVSRKMIAKRRGRLVFVSSVAAERPNPGQGFYAAAKQAVEALYRNLGLELAACGVTTVTLRLGYVDAGRGRRYLADRAPGVLANVPLGRALEINEVVDAVMFLLSDSAVGFNATEVTMDGGLTSGKSPEGSSSCVAGGSQ